MINKLIGVGAACIMASTANAGIEVGDSFTATRTGLSPSRLVTTNYDGSITDSASASRSGGTNASAGRLSFDVTSLNGNPYALSIYAFCVEIGEGFPDDPITYTAVDPTGVPEESPPGNMSSLQSQLMQDLYSRYYADVVNTNDDGGWGNSSDEVAAFQLVIWEISHESFSTTSLDGMKGELSLSLGAFQVTNTYSGTVATIAGDMITALGTGGWARFDQLIGATNATNQDLLIVVPSPAIAGLAGLGLVGMRRRRR